MTSSQNHSRLQLLLAFGAIYFIWGSTYLANQVAIESFPPFVMGGIRFLLSGILLFAWARITGARIPTLSEWRAAAISGCFLIVGGTGTVIWAQQYVPSGLTALLIATVPLWIVLVDWLRPNGQRPTLLTIIAVLVGAVGVVLMIAPSKLAGMDPLNHIGAMLLILGCCVSWSFGSVYSRYAPLPESKILSAGMQMMCGGFVLFILSLISGEFAETHAFNASWRSLVSLVYLVTFGAMAFSAYTFLLKASTAAKTATYAFVNPVIAMILGSLLAGESLTPRMMTGAVIILAAVALIIASKAVTKAPATRSSIAAAGKPISVKS